MYLLEGSIFEMRVCPVDVVNENEADALETLGYGDEFILMSSLDHF